LIEVIARDDVAAIGPLVLATTDLSKVRVQTGVLPRSFPLEALKDSQTGCIELSVLDIAVGFGAKEVFRNLTVIYELTPSTNTMHLAVAGGDPELVKLTWDRLRTSKVDVGRLAETAARFHRQDVLRWLLAEAPAAIQSRVACVAARKHLAGALQVLAELGFEFAGAGDEIWAAFAEWDSVFALELLPEPEVERWTRVVFLVGTERARQSLRQRSRHLPADFVDMTLVTAESGSSELVSWLAGEFYGGVHGNAVCGSCR
jgi:hypothetical protein